MAAEQTGRLKGVIPAIITPMDEQGAIDFALLEKQTEYLAAAGVHGFFVGGTTAEGAYLSTREKGEVFRAVRSVTGGRQFLCAAYIRSCTASVLEEMRALEKTEPDFVVAVSPYYLAMRQQDIKAHFRAIAREASAPLIIYNIPGNTHNPIALETVLELAEEDNVVGIKDSTGNFVEFSRRPAARPGGVRLDPGRRLPGRSFSDGGVRWHCDRAEQHAGGAVRPDLSGCDRPGLADSTKVPGPDQPALRHHPPVR